MASRAKCRGWMHDHLVFAIQSAPLLPHTHTTWSYFMSKDDSNIYLLLSHVLFSLWASIKDGQLIQPYRYHFSLSFTRQQRENHAHHVCISLKCFQSWKGIMFFFIDMKVNYMYYHLYCAVHSHTHSLDNVDYSINLTPHNNFSDINCLFYSHERASTYIKLICILCVCFWNEIDTFQIGGFKETNHNS